MNRLKRLTLKGFKSIEIMDLELGAINILIGANGAGKSNFISFFKMINEMMPERFQRYIGTSGRAQALLHYGPKITPQIEANLEFETENGTDTYSIRLFHAAGDTLIFAEESLSFSQPDWTSPRLDNLGAGHQETKINAKAQEGIPTAKTLKYLLDRCRVYHFHDTSATSAVRQSSYIDNNRWLMPDAGNLAAMLLSFREDYSFAYDRIIGTIRLIAPFFHDFVLEPDASRSVMLNWSENGSDNVFGPHQLSDGTLRAICLITLLLQPEDKLPELIVVDEPELGLHPYALNVIADLFNHASLYTQIIVSTQSTAFLDNFEPEDIITVDRTERDSRFQSQFQRLDLSTLQIWLDDYSLSEIWEKNIIGGGPH